VFAFKQDVDIETLWQRAAIQALLSLTQVLGYMLPDKFKSTMATMDKVA